MAVAGASQGAANPGDDESVKSSTAATADELKSDFHDSEITASVKSKFAKDDLVPAARVHVETENGVVTLTGSVSNEASLDRAISIARGVDGVVNVKSDLKIEPSGKTTSGEVQKTVDKVADSTKTAVKKTGEVIKDSAITADLKLKFAADDTVSASNIDIDTKNGVVTLNGTVKSDAELNRAVDIARKTDGVKNVISNLVVKAY